MTGIRPGRVRPAALHHPSRPAQHRYPQAAVDALCCPHCGAGLSPADGQFVCSSDHAFDVSKQGYVPLLGPRARTDTGDSADMVAARVAFLGAGFFRPVAEAIAHAAEGSVGPFAEIGAGTGYYLGAVLDSAVGANNCGLALDSSKYAARRAAADDRVISVVADAWSALPIRDSAVGVVLSVFAPRTPAEIARVLRPGGRLIAATPEKHHLVQLRERLDMLTVDEGKADRLADSFAGRLTPADRQLVEFDVVLHHAYISALIRMGPTARHLGADQLRSAIEGLPNPLTVTAAVTVSTFRA